MGRNADRDQSFTELVRLVGDPLFRTSLLLSGDWQQAEALVPTSLAKLYARGRWHLDHPLAYLRQVVVHKFISRRRRRSAGHGRGWSGGRGDDRHGRGVHVDRADRPARRAPYGARRRHADRPAPDRAAADPGPADSRAVG